ncbi:T9SS type A sorting domain-containing protein [Patiriisocius hiemis]|uniref:T9SS type A sorting domain-containing protein n=1 Tax=Patiriisocius hiemis TaxID=3075604 RepID=A0ABU2YD70_9FLAO|nr:T9SS type A sorting domain-containing protein [Constantimarinum sp. W242]MDT0554998.1 T9SS type A sorting domain-containing protein [Constantimarinum sp. W242]
MKNLLLSSVLLLTSAAAFSQLYVAPNASTSTDSYIYVDNQILFVEQDVNLVLNNNNPTVTEASIYLRNQSQLLQGTTSSNNDGTGLISVIQDSRSDSYDYNYWCSPVGNPTQGGGVAGNRNFGVLSINDSLGLTEAAVTQTTPGYNGSGSGDGSASGVNPLTISRRWLYMRPANSGWTSINNNNVVPAGLGFTMKGTNVTSHGNVHADPNNQRYDFRGRPNNGDITVTTANDGSILSGNPYPSALDLNRLFYDTTSSDIDGTMNDGNSEILQFRFWDEDRSINSHLFEQNKGGYATWIPGPSNPNGTNPGIYTVPTFVSYDAAGNPMPIDPMNDDTGLAYQRRFSPIGQGFIIKAGPSIGGDVTSNQITIRNEHRRFVQEGLANNSQFRSQGEIENQDKLNGSKSSSDMGFVRIYTMFGDSHYRDMVLTVSPGASYYFDRGLDALHPNDGGDTDAYFPAYHTENSSERENLVIQGVPDDYDMILPFAVKVSGKKNRIDITAVEEENLQGRNVFLYDSEINHYQMITSGRIATLEIEAGTYEDRYFLVYKDIDKIEKQNYEETKDAITASMDFFQNNRASQLEVGNPDNYEIMSATLFDMAGRMVYRKTNLGNANQFQLPTGNLSDGVYIVKLTTSDNIVIDYKMSVKN